MLVGESLNGLVKTVIPIKGGREIFFRALYDRAHLVPKVPNKFFAQDFYSRHLDELRDPDKALDIFAGQTMLVLADVDSPDLVRGETLSQAVQLL